MRTNLRPRIIRAGLMECAVLGVAAAWFFTGCDRSSVAVPRLRPGETVSRVRPADAGGWNKLADEQLRMLGRRGDPAHLAQAREAVENSSRLVPVERNPGALALRARVALAEHRFAEAKRDAERLREMMPGGAYPLQDLGDAHFQLGDYAAAERVWDEFAAFPETGTVAELLLAQLDVVHGRTERARERMEKALERARANDPAAADVMVACHVRLGELAFRSGDWDRAESHYAAALSVEPEGYSPLEHVAELRGAQGRVSEAEAIYTRLIERTGRAELMQALGDLFAFARRPGEARRWHDRAEEAYLASVRRGEVGAFHHLAGFYADSRPRADEAVRWAWRDLELRQTIHAQDALAWALFKAGRLEEARAALAQALATGTRDAHILHHAGMIRMSAGDLAGGAAALRQALASNPRYHAFHVHR
jgi:tetratricopeptide (TPR) repeat protein